MNINVRDIPEEGLSIQGSLDQDIFQLKETDVKPGGPVTWDLFVSLVSESILVQGTVSAGFQVSCARCMEYFPLRVEVTEFVFSEPLEDRATIDLTEAIREDILLVLPSYPHCEDGTPPRECRMAGKFEESEVKVVDEEPSGGQDIWSGLEGLQTPPEKESNE